MNDFRPETFMQFVTNTKPVWFLKLIWIGAFLFLVAVFFWTYKTDITTFWVYFLFVFIGLSIQSVFLYSMAYRIYNLGRKAFLQLNREDLQFIDNAKVYIKGFDLFSKKPFYNVDISIPIYDFNEADLILSEGSMILLGKSQQLGSTLVAAPVEIMTSLPKTSIAHSKLIDWVDERDRIQIEIKDDYYVKPFKIEFKNHYDEIKLWLIRYCQK